VADLISHIDQAKHNEKCANLLLNNAPEFRDWAITAAFYAAVHLVEACFSSRSDIGHTEKAPDRGKTQEHVYRLNKVKALAGSRAFRSYQKLFNASLDVRYLTKSSRGRLTAVDYYDDAAVRSLVQVTLPEVRTELEEAFGLNLK
jgi:hypothetical protein